MEFPETEKELELFFELMSLYESYRATKFVAADYHYVGGGNVVEENYLKNKEKYFELIKDKL